MNFVKLRIVPRTFRSVQQFPQFIKNFSEAPVSVVNDKLTSTGTTEESGKPKIDRPPFGKNLFIGKFDCDVLTYPEVLDRDKLNALNDAVSPVESLFSEVGSNGNDGTKKKLEFIKSCGIFGKQIPVQFGGHGGNTTEYARVAELISLDGSVALTLAAHQAISKGILTVGTEELKKYYLPQLARGELVAAFCLTEQDIGTDALSMKTEAKLSDDKKTWILNGRKLWIHSDDLEKLFLVFARTQVEDERGVIQNTVTAFMVETGFGGVSSRKPEYKVGMQASNICEVIFDNTPVPAKNVLGEVGDGLKVGADILNSARFSLGCSYIGILKQLLKTSVEHTIGCKQFGKPYIEFGLIQEKFANLTCLTYAVESMAYLTAGMMDLYEKPDCEIESAILKVFASEAVWDCIGECLDIFGGVGNTRDYAYDHMLRDVEAAMILEGPSVILKLLISLVGLQHAGMHLSETVKKVRNPMMHPMYILSRMWERRHQVNDNPKLTLGLDGYLHPSLQDPAKMLEYCVLRLQYAVEVILSRHGQAVSDHQMELRRIADIAIDIYAMTAVLGRASRSYCIGLQNAENEIQIATTFCWDAYQRVKTNVKEIDSGPYITNDINYEKLSGKLFENKNYFPVHPLTRNF